MSSRIAAFLCYAFLFGGMVGTAPAQAATVTVVVDQDVPQAAFAAADVQRALESRGHRATAGIRDFPVPSQVPPRGNWHNNIRFFSILENLYIHQFIALNIFFTVITHVK